MSTSQLRALACAGPTRPRPRSLDRRLGRFTVLHRPRVMALADVHPRLADLAASFPALLFALAVPRRGFDPRPAISRVIEGAALKEVAWLADVPLWLRRLPPETFDAALMPIATTAGFGARIGNVMPPSPRHAAVWLDVVREAHELADEAVAVWMAGECARSPRPWTRQGNDTRRVCLWAWYTLDRSGPAAALLDKPWTSAMSFDTAYDHASAWLQRIELNVCLGDGMIGDMWFEPAVVDGFEFVPLDTAAAVAAEAAAMANCLATYGGSVVNGRCRLWSVRRSGERVATLELSKWSGNPLLGVSQLYGPGNSACPVEAAVAAARWLHGQPAARQTGAGRVACAVPLSAARWRDLWRPYWLAKRRIPAWLPLLPSLGALRNI